MGKEWRARTSLHLAARPALLVPLVIAAAALALRLVRLGSPNLQIPLDERVYVPNAQDVLRFGTEADLRGGTPFIVVHPPVGKWFIAFGMRLFGVDSPFGWRFFGALFGALAVLLVYLIAMRLWGSRPIAVLAATLFGVEGLWFVLSRIAMLEVYVASFLLLAVWMLLEDRARPASGFRWWRIGSGVSAGLALATKWTAAPPVLALLALALIWERSRPTRETGDAVADPIALDRRARRPLSRFGSAVATFTVLPFFVYFASYTPWFLDSSRFVPASCSRVTNVVSIWGCYQADMFVVASGLNLKGEGPQHPVQSDAWSWPWMGRPITHFATTTGAGSSVRVREVLGLPNPLVWPTGFVALVPLGWWTVRGRRRGSPHRDPVASLILALFLVNYVPYLLATLMGRQVFLYYAAPISPFVALAVTHVLYRLTAGGTRLRSIALAYAAAAVLLFGYFYPLYTAVPIPEAGLFGWRAHIWMTADCDQAIFSKNFCWL